MWTAEWVLRAHLQQGPAHLLQAQYIRQVLSDCVGPAWLRFVRKSCGTVLPAPPTPVLPGILAAWGVERPARALSAWGQARIAAYDLSSQRMGAGAHRSI